MKILTTSSLDAPHFHIFLMSAPGAGKTKFIGDFHEAGEHVLRVGEFDRVTLPARGIHVPTIMPETEGELRAIIEQPEAVIERVVRKIPGYEDYAPKTIAFDNLRLLQRVVFGVGAYATETVFDGAVVLPAHRGSGIMAMPNKRDATGIPANKDYRLLDDHMRSLVWGITKMPYHTIVTTHEERDLTIESRLKLSGDPDKDKLVARTISGYPALDGFSLKHDLPGLISDYFLRLEWDGEQYFIHTRPSQGFHARTRINQVMPPAMDWTERNAYHLLRQKYEQAQQKAQQKKPNGVVSSVKK